MASVCFWAVENCWAKNSIPRRRRVRSASFVSARLSHRWRSWTTLVAITCPTERAATFVARRASIKLHVTAAPVFFNVYAFESIVISLFFESYWSKHQELFLENCTLTPVFI
ncbi:hypothetical protein F2P79_008860 [Pimephales promelas]|nr:hypothetical protein F2P79_008860 [Pimephales promelas]